LASILSIHTERVVSNDYVVRYDNRFTNCSNRSTQASGAAEW